LWQDLIQEKTAILSAPERGYELDQFLQGKVAMQLTGPWTLAQLESTKVDYNAFPIPYLNKPATVIGGENIFMMKTTLERQKAAWKFMEYVLSEEFQIQWSMGTGYLPINQQVRSNPVYQEYLNTVPKTKVFLDQAKYGRSRPIIPGYSRLSAQLGRKIEAVLMGKDKRS
jgi:multiple sugar transport system substrate-binding protein